MESSFFNPEGLITGFLSIFAMGFGVVSLILLVAMWRIFEKAQQPGWASLIPVYNFIVLLDVVRKPWWWLLLLFVPFVNFVITIWLVNSLSLAFGRGLGFTLGLLFLPFIFLPVLAFDSSEYRFGAASFDY